jgi:probable F420-dependent oxidoreductase
VWSARSAEAGNLERYTGSNSEFQNIRELKEEQMKVGIHEVAIGPYADREVYRSFAVNADRLDFSTLWNLEHVMMFEQVESTYPYGQLPDDLTFPILNPYVGLAFLAGQTKNIRLATGVALMTQYPPLLLAKLIGTLDYLSDGRFVFGIGVGWLKEASLALGVPWKERSARMREYVEALRVVWGEETNDYNGEFVEFEGVLSYPKPVAGTVPVFMGGNTETALKRTAEYADGWFGLKLTAAEAAEKIGRLRELLAENGRADDPFEIAVSPAEGSTPEILDELNAAGVDEVVLWMDHFDGVTEAAAVPALLQRLAEEWVEPARALAAAPVS